MKYNLSVVICIIWVGIAIINSINFDGHSVIIWLATLMIIISEMKANIYIQPSFRY